VEWSERIWEERGMWLKREWEMGWAEMVGWYQSDDFGRERAKAEEMGAGGVEMF
jgi:hypothetical protein